MKNNKKNKKRKNDLRHLSRKELIDLICDMRRPNPSKEVPTIEEAEKEQKRLNRRAAYRQTFRGTVAVLIVVAAVSVLVATLWMPVLQIYGSSMSPTLEPGQIVISDCPRWTNFCTGSTMSAFTLIDHRRLFVYVNAMLRTCLNA